MTVKTNNKILFNMYMDALEEGDGNENNSWSLLRFWDLYTDSGISFVDAPNNYREAVKITNAIIEGEEVKLEERRYALRAKNVTDDDGDDIYLIFRYGRFEVSSAITKQSESEWEDYFNRMPYMHREDFEEVGE